MSTLYSRMRQRRATVPNWTEQNPVLGPGEIGLVLEDPLPTGAHGSTWMRLKIGDGTTAWNDLPFINPGDPDAAGGGGTYPRTVFVDPSVGDDATGAREEQAQPFATLHAAVAAAVAGDIVVCSHGPHLLFESDPEDTPLLLEKQLYIHAPYSIIGGTVSFEPGSEGCVVVAEYLGEVRSKEQNTRVIARQCTMVKAMANSIFHVESAVNNAVVEEEGDLYIQGSQSSYSPTSIECAGGLTLLNCAFMASGTDPVITVHENTGGVNLQGVSLKVQSGHPAIVYDGSGTLTINAVDTSCREPLPGNVVLSVDSQMSYFGDAFDPAGTAATVKAEAKAYTDSMVISVFRDAGNWNANSGEFPTYGTAPDGSIRQGDTYIADRAGTINGIVFDVGDSFRALVDVPGQDEANWARFETNTEQATPSYRGTMATADNATAIAGTDETKAVTPKSWWAAFTNSITTSGFLAAVRGVLLQGFAVGSNVAITASDSILAAFGKTQGQINAINTTLSGAAMKSSNLGDLTNYNTARNNLYLDGIRKVTDIDASIAASDHIIAFYALTQARVMNMPPAGVFPGRVYTIMDGDGTASPATQIIIAPGGTDTVDGLPYYAIETARGAVEVFSDGVSTWHIRIRSIPPVVATPDATASATGLVELATAAEVRAESGALQAITASLLPQWGTPVRTVRVVILTNVTIASQLTAGNTHNGVTLVNGDIVLLVGQSTQSQNGPYVVSASPARYHSTFLAHVGRTYMATEGTNCAKRHIVYNGAATGTLGTTAIVYEAVAMEIDAVIHTVQAGKGVEVDTTDAQQPKVGVKGRARITSAQTTTSTSATAVPGSAVALEANKSYFFRVWGRYRSSNAAGNPGMGIRVPSGATVTVWMRRGTTSGTINQAQTIGSDSLLTGAASMTASTDFPFYLDAEIQMGGTAGNAEMVYASANASYTAQVTSAVIAAEEC